jgi:hypothetical protein
MHDARALLHLEEVCPLGFCFLYRNFGFFIIESPSYLKAQMAQMLEVLSPAPVLEVLSLVLELLSLAQMQAWARCTQKVNLALPLIPRWKRQLRACMMMMMMMLVACVPSMRPATTAMQPRLIA